MGLNNLVDVKKLFIYTKRLIEKHILGKWVLKTLMYSVYVPYMSQNMLLDMPFCVNK